MKIIIAILCLASIYGSAFVIGFLTDWKVGALLIVFAIGHNIDKH